jgi:hypothetical protein
MAETQVYKILLATIQWKAYITTRGFVRLWLDLSILEITLRIKLFLRIKSVPVSTRLGPDPVRDPDPDTTYAMIMGIR